MDIRAFLSEKGPCLSSTIKNELLQEGLTDEAARQQISRAKGGICRLKNIQFPQRENFLYLKGQDKFPLFKVNLVNAFNITSSIHKCIITGLNNFGGSVSKDKLKVLSACPKARKKKKTFDQVVRELKTVGLINVDDNEQCSLHEDAFSSTKTYTDSRVTSYLNDFLREILALWLINNSFVSYDAISLNGDFCSYYWDIVAPSYLLPLIGKKGKALKPGFVVADIIPQYDINDDDIDYFIRKVESCFMGKNTRPFIPILIGYRFTGSALNILKNRNILAATVNNFFGEEVEKLLTNIAEIFKSSTIKESNGIENIDAILKAVAKIEGPTNNFRGHFFEFIVGFIVSNSHPGNVALNKKISKDGKSAEIDVSVTTSNEIIVYECKGKKPKQLVTDDEIEKWKRRISFIYEYFKGNPEHSNKHLIFNFWTTSDFSDEANTKFDEMKKGVKKYSIEKKNGCEVYDCSKNLKLEEVSGILKQYFIQ